MTTSSHFSDLGGQDNAHRERLWFSPHCLRIARQRNRVMFAE